MLTERQELILSGIVQDYTHSGAPVGSKLLVNQLPIHVSSATIRNEMAVLEEMGLIEKTHLSSGRVPSINGYRYYVDHLTFSKVNMMNDIALIHKALDSSYHKIDELVQKSANILSDLTNYTALTLQPEQATNRLLQGFRLVALGDQRVMAILVTDNGDAETELFRIPKGVTGQQLESVVNLINDRLVGYPLSVVLEQLKSVIPNRVNQYLHSTNGFIGILDEVIMKAMRDRLYVGGEMNLLSFTDQSDISYLKPLYSMLGQSGEIAKFIGNSGDGVSVQIGSEMSNELLKNYSVITGTYDVGSHGKGIIAVLGPTRMPYSKVITLVDAFRSELSSRLLGYYKENK
ncbi:heat-inducible transcriptional repressor HrcA [Nicoliella spurrieriana]|uniref:Heat-inducible transcription repressor HrcA n=1 Tax=Nicoliella spurrieriana TaxID=2925830 RepID=A0A976RRJ0_9LACO|nr:heat-inducible transcriptional repressor HrcA [Nicoliella spurrieriana]UQS86512.1 heat-inducible transcriptional repressor HrcA [Nicoliella spurrieriana]